MNKALLYVILPSFFLISCGGGGGERIPVSKWCQPTYEAMNFEPGTATETADLIKDQPAVIKEGTFVSQEHDIYYRDTVNDIRLHVRARYALNEETGNLDTTREVLCSGGRGLGINGKSFNFQLPFVHKVIAQGDKKLVSSGTYFISVQNNPGSARLTTTITLDDKSADGSLKTGLPEENLDTLMFYKFADENFELRGKLADAEALLNPDAEITTPEVFMRINYSEFVEEDENDDDKTDQLSTPSKNKSRDKGVY